MTDFYKNRFSVENINQSKKIGGSYKHIDYKAGLQMINRYNELNINGLI